MRLKYGCNPHQAFATATPIDESSVPLRLLNGTPSLINFLDALNAWQLVREVRSALGLAAAASFKHGVIGLDIVVPKIRWIQR